MKAAATHNPAPVTKDDALYLVDNGAVYCGSHMGQTPRYTGRDISGQEILEFTPEVLAMTTDFTPRCENCGRRATNVQ